MYQADACGRPPVEVAQTIICASCFITEKPHLTGSAGGDWDLFSSCCPFVGNQVPAIERQTYYSARNCTNSYCTTSNETIANNWDTCVKNAARTKPEAFANKSVDEAYCGRCEYINKDYLRNGLKKNGASTSPKGTGAMLLIALVFGATFL